MCGIVGVAGNLFKKDVDAFNDLLYMDALRGLDSTGVVGVKPNGEWDVIKNIGLPSDLMDLKGYDKIVNPSARCLIGHNRHGTMGAKTKSNAHPFSMTNVVGVHNGTVPYTSKSAMKDGSEFGTDSEAIYNNIDWYGIEATIPKLEGAWALVYYHAPSNNLCMIRNDKRPLVYGLSEDGKQLYWASEAYMLRAAAARNGVKFKDDRLYILPEDTLFQFEVTKGGAEFGEPVETKIKGKEVVVAEPTARFPQYGYNRQSYLPWTPTKPEAKKEVEETDEIDWDEIDWMTVEFDDENPLAWHTDETYSSWRRRVASLKAQKPVEPPPSKPLPDNVVSLTYRNPKTREFMSREEFDKITQSGCDWCNGDIQWGDKVTFADNSTGGPECFCETCIKTSQISHYLGA